jgi:hypothetical protein
MGMPMFRPSSGSITTAPNPDPKNFKIKAISVTARKRSICVVEVNYPGCTTFEGDKILVYEAELKVFSNPSYLDPHFTATSRLIARFPATDEGRRDAIAFADWKADQ